MLLSAVTQRGLASSAISAVAKQKRQNVNDSTALLGNSHEQ